MGRQITQEEQEELEKLIAAAGGITNLRFTRPDCPGQVFVFSRERAPNPEEIVRKYMSQIGSKGGKIGGRIGGKATTPAKRRASRNNGRLGGRPRKDQRNA